MHSYFYLIQHRRDTMKKNDMLYLVFRRYLLGDRLASRSVLYVRERFLASGEKTVRVICAQISVCIDGLGGCALLHFFGVHGERGACSKAPTKNGFHAPAGQSTAQNHQTWSTDRYHKSERFLSPRWCGAQRRTARVALKAFQMASSRKIHISARRGLSMPKLMLMIDDMNFISMSPFWVAFH